LKNPKAAQLEAEIIKLIETENAKNSKID